MNTLKHLFDRNVIWAESITKNNPEFFSALSKQQLPEYLWIGCSDSRVSSNQIVDLMPGEIFVHRNIANVVIHTDLNCLSVIQYAVEVLKIKHIIVCGHYGCGGVQAALGPGLTDPLDSWIELLRAVRDQHSEELAALDSDDERLARLCELNVMQQVRNVANLEVVRSAWLRNQQLAVHGWIYDLHDGLLRDLNVQIDGIAD